MNFFQCKILIPLPSEVGPTYIHPQPQLLIRPPLPHKTANPNHAHQFTHLKTDTHHPILHYVRSSAQLVAFAAAARLVRSASVFQPFHRLDAILDSLASICVREGKGEVYAVAMQFYERDDGEGGKLALTIAGNCGVPPQVVTHLEIVWNLLQGIINCYHGVDKNKGKQYSIPCWDPSPDYRPARAASRPLVADLKATIYRHSIEKFTSHIKKRYQPFMTFMERLEEYMSKGPDGDPDVWNSLLQVREILTFILENLLPTEFQYEDLLLQLDALNQDARIVMKSSSVFEWAGAVEGKY